MENWRFYSLKSRTRDVHLYRHKAVLRVMVRVDVRRNEKGDKMNVYEIASTFPRVRLSGSCYPGG